MILFTRAPACAPVAERIENTRRENQRDQGPDVLQLPRERPLECREAGSRVRGEIGEYQGVVRVPRRVFQQLLPDRPTPERCVEAYYLERTRFESIAERKLRRRQLTEDGNVEITGRDLRGGSAAATRSAPVWR